ncbi:MAG TPA: biotin--[acetyl-CoA-carboxylase] ligase [Flavobacteriales bacterium]|nr:biotin--[acetyl-CoA-carboxylase] ligase [Flavobacteriales bacterium]
MESSREISPQSVKGHRLIELTEVTSTNKFLELLMDKGSGEQGLIVVADYQSEGRGMNGNSWTSEKGRNLLMSMLYFPENLLIQNQFYLSKCSALAVSKAIDRIVGAEMSKIKWPNDVFINNKKTAGILIQCSIKGENAQYSFLGIGVNLNQNTFSVENATSLMSETGQKIEINEFLSYLVEELDIWLKVFAEGNFEQINSMYYKKLIGYQQWLAYQKGTEKLIGKIIRIEDDGHLLMELKDGKQQRFAVKEISLVPAETNDRPTY